MREIIFGSNKNTERSFYTNKVNVIEDEEALLKIQLFEERVALFESNFYLDGELTIDSSAHYGDIDRVSLYISNLGINTEVLNETVHILDKLQEKGFSLEGDSNNLIEKYPQLNTLYEIEELIAHEHFHLLQFIFCKSVNTFYKAMRKHHTIRVYLLFELIRMNVKLEKEVNKSLFSSILKLKNTAVKNKFMDMINNTKVETTIVKNFYNYKTDEVELNCIDIMEGSTIALQKIVSKNKNIKTVFNEEKLRTSDEPEKNYKKYCATWDYYIEQGGVEQTIFFIITHQSLKYGLVDDGKKTYSAPSPQNLFAMLCKNISKYELEYNTLHLTPFNIDNNLKKFDLGSEQIQDIYKLKKIFFQIKEDIRAYSEKVDTNYSDEAFEKEIIYENSYIFAPLKTVNEQIVEDYPIIKSDFFLPLLLINYDFFVKFIFGYLPSMLKTIEFQGIFQNNTTMVSDNFFVTLADDIDEYMRTNSTRCCDNHTLDKVGIFELICCSSENSLKNRYKRATGKEFASLFN